jgi:hypothetical protein
VVKEKEDKTHRNASFLAATYAMKATLSFICEERRRGRRRRRSSVYIKTGSGQTQGKLKRNRFTFRVSRFTHTKQGGFSGGPYMMGGQYTIADMCENGVFFEPFLQTKNVETLPRQARDKHRLGKLHSKNKAGFCFSP